jgi:hypothetical protein
MITFILIMIINYPDIGPVMHTFEFTNLEDCRATHEYFDPNGPGCVTKEKNDESKVHSPRW